MKKSIVMACMVALCVGAYAQKKSAKVTYSVPMDCQHCVDKIQKNIAFEKGVRDLSTSLKGKTVVVTFNTQRTDTVALKSAFKKLGYEVKTLSFE